MLLSGGDDKIFRRIMLQNQPHAFYIILCIAPVPQRIHISQLQMVLKPLCNPSGCQRDFPGYKIFPAALGFMIEQNSVHREHPVGFPVFFRNPESVLFRYRVGTVWMKRRSLLLGNFFHLAVQFRSRCLVNPCLPVQTQDPHGLQDAQNADGIHISGIFRNIKGHLDMRLGCQIVDLVRLHQTDDAHKRRRVCQVPVMQRYRMRGQQMIDSGCIGDGCAAGDAVNLISFFQKKFCQIGTILSCDTCNQCFFYHTSFLNFLNLFHYSFIIFCHSNRKKVQF